MRKVRANPHERSKAYLTSVATQLHHQRSVGWTGGAWSVGLRWAHANDEPGEAIPPAAKLTTGSLFSLAVSFNKWNGAWISFAYV